MKYEDRLQNRIDFLLDECVELNEIAQEFREQKEFFRERLDSQTKLSEEMLEQIEKLESEKQTLTEEKAALQIRVETLAARCHELEMMIAEENSK